MYCKKVVIDIFSNRTPYELTIFDACKNICAKSIVNSQKSKVCFKTQSKIIKVVAKFESQTIVKVICLYDCSCQNVYVELPFKTIISYGILNVITLTDAVYNLPVADAILNFNQLNFIN